MKVNAGETWQKESSAQVDTLAAPLKKVESGMHPSGNDLLSFQWILRALVYNKESAWSANGAALIKIGERMSDMRNQQRCFFVLK